MKILERLLFGLILVGMSVSSAQAYPFLSGVARKMDDGCVETQLASASIKVYSLDASGNRISSPLPTLYADAAGSTTRSNPFNSGPSIPWTTWNGYWGFWIADGRYEVVVTHGSGASLVTYSQFMQAPAPTSAASGFLNVKDAPYFAAGNGTTDDTLAIKRAVNDLGLNGGGVLHFPNGTYIVGTNPNTGGEQQLPIVIPSGVTIEGTSGAYFSGSKIYLPSTATNKTVLKIAECTRQAAVREIEIQSATADKTTGILATGKYPNSSYWLSLSNMTIRGFNIGFDVQATSDSEYGWQLGSSKIEHVKIVECNTGMHVDAQNAELQISNSVFGAGTNGTAILIDHGGIFQLHQVFGAGSNSDNFIWLRGRHGYIDASSIQCEGFKNTLVNDFKSTLVDQYQFPIRIFNSILGSKILLKENCTFVSSGNTYFSTSVETVWDGGSGHLPRRPDGAAYPTYQSGGGTTSVRPNCDPLPTDGHADNVLIYSTGDYFYPEIAGSSCPYNNGFIPLAAGVTGDFLLTGNSKLAFRGGQVSADFEVPVNIGVPGFNYNLKRNGSNGFLDLFGTQAAPFRGFNFNGPIQLHSASWATIQAWGTMTNGAVMYCTDCYPASGGGCTTTPPSTPAPPAGAIMTFVNGFKCQ
jgi:hypothetical protein